MNAKLKPNLEIVHEAIDERQHVRTNMPIQVRLFVRKKEIECKVIDISLGGIAINLDEVIFAQVNPPKPGTILRARLDLKLQSLTLNIACELKVVECKGALLRASFNNVAKDQLDTLRYLISSYISGELVKVDGVFTVMQRENYIKARKVKSDTTRSTLERAKAIAGSLAFLAIGLIVFGTIASKLFMYLFSVQSVSAHVDGNPYIISMPDNGYVKFLVNSNVTEVSAGQPIATVSSQLMTQFNTPDDIVALQQFSKVDLQTLFSKALVETMITSPCDCWVYYPNNHNLNRYAYKEQELMHVIPKNDPLIIKASFPFTKLSDLSSINKISVSFFGQEQTFPARVSSASVNEDTQLIDVVLVTDELIAKDKYLQPAAVSVIKGIAAWDGLVGPVWNTLDKAI